MNPKDPDAEVHEVIVKPVRVLNPEPALIGEYDIQFETADTLDELQKLYLSAIVGKSRSEQLPIAIAKNKRKEELKA